MKEYPQLTFRIEGHTDASGADSYNQTLSEKRASSVSSYLAQQDVQNSRLTTMGYGEDQPIADNSTSTGRAQNRRVEVAIFANDKMKRMAEKGTL